MTYEKVEKIINEEFTDFYLSDYERKMLLETVYFHAAGQEKFPGSYKNLLLVYEDEYRLDSFVEKLGTVFEKIFERKNIGKKINEADLAKNPEIIINSGNEKQLFVITNCNAKEPDNWNEIRKAYEANPKDLKVVCVTREAERRLAKDEHIYFRVINARLALRDYGWEDAYLSLLGKIKENKLVLECSAEFCDEIKDYIKTVYEKADLKKQDFVNDVYNRVVNKIEPHEVEAGKVFLSLKHVPFYKKQSTLPINAWDDLGIERTTIPIDAKYESDTLNILITNVSKIILKDGKTQKRDYVDEEGNSFEGEVTNEAPIKSIANRLSKQGRYINEIIFIESETVKSTIVINGKEYTHIGYLKEKITDYLQDYDYNTKYVDIGIKDEPSKDDVSNTVYEIYERLIAVAETKKSINIYIESNGGVRYVLTMLLSLTKTLENYYDNVHISEVTSMILTQNPVKIFNTKDVFDTVQITGIAGEFVNYGRINSLQRFVKEYKSDLSDEQVYDVEKVLDKLKKTADDIQLCRTVMILKDFYGENNLKQMIEEFEEKYSGGNIPAIISIFSNILKLILNELNQIIYYNYKMGEDIVCYLPHMIKWCLEKSFIQQALTFVAERLPEYLFVTDKMTISPELSEAVENANKDGKYENRYYFVAHIHEFVSRINNSSINRTIDIIKESGRLKQIVGEAEWEKIYIKDVISNSVDTEKLRKIADRAVNFVEQYKRLNNFITDKKLQDLMISNGFDVAGLDRKVEISNKKSSTLGLTMRGKYLKDGKEEDHDNLKTISGRVTKFLPVVIAIALDEDRKKRLDDQINNYDCIIEELFSDIENGTLSTALKEKYSNKQSAKFYIGEAMEAGHIKSNMDANSIQKLLYVYSVCKEQRNMSNHAHVSENDEAIALDSGYIKIVINALLNFNEEVRNGFEIEQESANEEVLGTVNRPAGRISIGSVGFSSRTCKSLQRAGKKYLDDLANMTSTDLLKIRNLGRNGAEEVIHMCAKYGINTGSGYSDSEI